MVFSLSKADNFDQKLFDYSFQTESGYRNNQVMEFTIDTTVLTVIIAVTSFLLIALVAGLILAHHFNKKKSK